MKIRFTSVVAAGILVGVLGAADGALAKAKPPRNGGKPQDHAIGASRNEAMSEQGQVSSARTEVERAKREVQQARAKAIETRKQIEKVEKEHDSTPELAAARKLVEQDRATYEQLSQPLLKQVHEGPQYQAAAEALAAARARLESAPEAGTAESRERLAIAYARAQAALRELDEEAIAANPQAKAAKAALAASEDRLRALTEQRNAAVAKDSRLEETRQGITKAEADLAAAEKQLAGEIRQAEGAERRLYQEERQRQAMQSRERRQPGRVHRTRVRR